ncbi:TRAP transporter substrate-binding protein [Marispirochaeta sp.]|uniref:TRAP transporter substrate-binding protein n=1 Tax=Marispirochaeta sp. TaxID=2038653 RepID=UPI0029C6D82F|nr:TRAP transporter substrate-binding protein [Marispirochaeta sp.]
MKKGLLVVLVLFLCIPSVLIAEGSGEKGTSQEKKIVMTFGEADSLGTPINLANALFCKLVTEKTDGMITVNHIAGESLGNDIQVIEQMMEGSVQFYGDVAGWYANWVKDLAILNWGFTFDDNDHVQRFFNSNSFEALSDELIENAGIKILGIAPTQPRILFSRKPVHTINDLNGLKMRVPDIRTYMLLWQTFETNPNRVAWGEVYLGMKTGLLEAAEGPIGAAYGAKFHESGPNVTLTNHLVSTYQVSMNNALFESLSPENQKILLEAGQEAADLAREVAEEGTIETLDKMVNEGATLIELTPEARNAFVKKSTSAVETMENDGEWRKGLWQEVRDLAQ